MKLNNNCQNIGNTYQSFYGHSFKKAGTALTQNVTLNLNNQTVDIRYNKNEQQKIKSDV